MRYFSIYEHCDDGAIAEGFSESVSRLLVEDWRNVDYLFASPHSSAKFRAFVVKPVNVS